MNSFFLMGVLRTMECPLCRSTSCSDYLIDKNRKYCQCENCKLIFVLPEYFLTIEDEKSRYIQHNNDINDPGYLRFLSRLFMPVSKLVCKGAHGLDFGCGPGPALAEMFESNGYIMDVYDPYFEPDTSVFKKEYDFIATTEVVEHLYKPHEEIKRLWDCLKINGVLAIMTMFAGCRSKKQFLNWFYIRDLTHVCFYSEETFKWLAEELKAELIIPVKDVVLLCKR